MSLKNKASQWPCHFLQWDPRDLAHGNWSCSASHLSPLALHIFGFSFLILICHQNMTQKWLYGQRFSTSSVSSLLLLTPPLAWDSLEYTEGIILYLFLAQEKGLPGYSTEFSGDHFSIQLSFRIWVGCECSCLIMEYLTLLPRSDFWF